MRVTSSEVMGSSRVDDDNERKKGEDTGGVDEKKAALIRHDVFPPIYTINISLRCPFLSNRHGGRSFTLSTCGTYTPILRVCDAILAALRLAVYKGGQVGYDMGGNFVHFHVFGIRRVTYVKIPI